MFRSDVKLRKPGMDGISLRLSYIAGFDGESVSKREAREHSRKPLLLRPKVPSKYTFAWKTVFC